MPAVWPFGSFLRGIAGLRPHTAAPQPIPPPWASPASAPTHSDTRTHAHTRIRIHLLQSVLHCGRQHRTTCSSSPKFLLSSPLLPSLPHAATSAELLCPAAGDPRQSDATAAARSCASHCLSPAQFAAQPGDSLLDFSRISLGCCSALFRRIAVRPARGSVNWAFLVFLMVATRQKSDLFRFCGGSVLFVRLVPADEFFFFRVSVQY